MSRGSESSDGRESWLIPAVAAIVSALAALGGAYVGGETANRGARELQRATLQQAERRELRAAGAVARALFQDVTLAKSAGDLSLRAARWRGGAALDIELSGDDRKLLAARLRAGEWQDLAQALGLLAVVRGSYDEDPACLDREDQVLIDEFVAEAVEGLEALRRLAGTPDALVDDRTGEGTIPAARSC